MLTACKQPGLHQTIKLMFMLYGLEISKALWERVFEKKLPEKSDSRTVGPSGQLGVVDSCA